VAASVVLLIGAGLFVRTLRNLEGLNAGFNRENLLLFRVDPRLSGYAQAGILSLYQRLIGRIEAVPGVTSATISRHPLLSGGRRSSTVSVQGKPSGGESDDAHVNVVAPNFMDTMEIQLMLGRDLTDGDNQAGQKVALINQTFAQKYFGDENPIAGRFGFGGAANAGQIEIVGVVRDSKYASLKEPATPTVYTPYLQGPGEQMNFAVRTSGDAATLVPAIREAVREIDPNLPLFDVRTQNQQVERLLAQERIFATLSSFFGVLASLLACIGLYGVMSYGVARRTNEIGLRMALGARSVDVTRMVMRETMTLVVIGMIIGLGTALATTRFVESMLFGLEPTDPVTIVAGCLAMLGVAAAAGYLPARRASLVDPMTALRYE
jgi:predicted permease